MATPNQTTHARIGPTARDMAAGRVLLRLLEHGGGPSVEISWPASPGERQRLAGTLARCFGMKSALLDRAGRLYSEQGKRGQSWSGDLNHYSSLAWGMERAPPHAEDPAIERIRNHHGPLPGAMPVRLFPRTVIGRLLGSFDRLMNGAYGDAQTIQGGYRLSDRQVLISAIRVDGERIDGVIELVPPDPACR